MRFSPHMRSSRLYYTDPSECPVRNVLDQLADKWSVLIITALAERPYRFGELKREIGDISQRMLTQTLRDLQADTDTLGRSYFPDIDVAQLTDAQKLVLVDDIDADLAAAAATLPLLPTSARRAVALAHGLFAE